MSLRSAIRGWFLAAAALPTAVLAGDPSFFGAGGGVIPDNSTLGVDTTFNVSGLTGEVRSIAVGVSVTHSYLGDLTAELISPGGVARVKLFGRVGVRRGQGADSSNLSGQYLFVDGATSDFWVAAANAVDTASNVPPGAFRSSTAGVSFTDVGGCSTHLSLVFGGLSGTRLNGNWTLRITDAALTDTGTVNAAASYLTIGTRAIGPAPLFRSGFETGELQGELLYGATSATASSTIGSCRPPVDSLSGLGRTDYLLLRNTGGGSNGAVTWSYLPNDGTASPPAVQSFVFANASDFFGMGDFDGDGLSDATVYNVTSGRFRVRRSSRPNDAPLSVNLGQTNDDPQMFGDIDGDRVTDFSVVRQPQNSTTVELITRRSVTADVVSRSFILPAAGAFPFMTRDYSGGDARAEFGVQYASGLSGEFRIFDPGTGAQIDAFLAGEPSNNILPGNYAGDERTDVAFVRPTGGMWEWTPRVTPTGPGAATLQGLSSSDFLLAGDYDGDGVNDYATWRSGAPTKFVIRLSTDPNAPAREVTFGAPGDYPVSNWDVH